MCDGVGRHRAAVAQDGEAVAQLEYLRHLVRDVDDGRTLGPEASHHAEEHLHLRVGKRAGRLVEDQQARALKQCARDLHHLTQRHGQLLHACVGVDVHLKLVEYAPCLIAHARPVSEAEAGARLPAEE